MATPPRSPQRAEAQRPHAAPAEAAGASGRERDRERELGRVREETRQEDDRLRGKMLTGALLDVDQPQEEPPPGQDPPRRRVRRGVALARVDEMLRIAAEAAAAAPIAPAPAEGDREFMECPSPSYWHSIHAFERIQEEAEERSAAMVGKAEQLRAADRACLRLLAEQLAGPEERASVGVPIRAANVQSNLRRMKAILQLQNATQVDLDLVLAELGAEEGDDADPGTPIGGQSLLKERNGIFYIDDDALIPDVLPRSRAASQATPVVKSMDATALEEVADSQMGSPVGSEVFDRSPMKLESVHNLHAGEKTLQPSQSTTGGILQAAQARAAEAETPPADPQPEPAQPAAEPAATPRTQDPSPKTATVVESKRPSRAAKRSSAQGSPAKAGSGQGLGKVGKKRSSVAAVASFRRGSESRRRVSYAAEHEGQTPTKPGRSSSRVLASLPPQSSPTGEDSPKAVLPKREDSDRPFGVFGDQPMAKAAEGCARCAALAEELQQLKELLRQKGEEILTLKMRNEREAQQAKSLRAEVRRGSAMLAEAQSLSEGQGGGAARGSVSMAALSKQIMHLEQQNADLKQDLLEVQRQKLALLVARQSKKKEALVELRVAQYAGTSPSHKLSKEEGGYRALFQEAMAKLITVSTQRGDRALRREKVCEAWEFEAMFQEDTMMHLRRRVRKRLAKRRWDIVRSRIRGIALYGRTLRVMAHVLECEGGPLGLIQSAMLRLDSIDQVELQTRKGSKWANLTGSRLGRPRTEGDHGGEIDVNHIANKVFVQALLRDREETTARLRGIEGQLLKTVRRAGELELDRCCLIFLGGQVDSAQQTCITREKTAVQVQQAMLEELERASQLLAAEREQSKRLHALVQSMRLREASNREAREAKLRKKEASRVDTGTQTDPVATERTGAESPSRSRRGSDTLTSPSGSLDGRRRSVRKAAANAQRAQALAQGMQAEMQREAQWNSAELSSRRPGTQGARRGLNSDDSTTNLRRRTSLASVDAEYVQSPAAARLSIDSDEIAQAVGQLPPTVGGGLLSPHSPLKRRARSLHHTVSAVRAMSPRGSPVASSSRRRLSLDAQRRAKIDQLTAASEEAARRSREAQQEMRRTNTQLAMLRGRQDGLVQGAKQSEQNSSKLLDLVREYKKESARLKDKLDRQQEQLAEMHQQLSGLTENLRANFPAASRMVERLLTSLAPVPESDEQESEGANETFPAEVVRPVLQEVTSAARQVRVQAFQLRTQLTRGLLAAQNQLSHGLRYVIDALGQRGPAQYVFPGGTPRPHTERSSRGSQRRVSIDSEGSVTPGRERAPSDFRRGTGLAHRSSGTVAQASRSTRHSGGSSTFLPPLLPAPSPVEGDTPRLEQHARRQSEREQPAGSKQRPSTRERNPSEPAPPVQHAAGAAAPRRSPQPEAPTPPGAFAEILERFAVEVQQALLGELVGTPAADAALPLLGPLGQPGASQPVTGKPAPGWAPAKAPAAPAPAAGAAPPRRGSRRSDPAAGQRESPSPLPAHAVAGAPLSGAADTQLPAAPAPSASPSSGVQPPGTQQHDGLRPEVQAPAHPLSGGAHSGSSAPPAPPAGAAAPGSSAEGSTRVAAQSPQPHPRDALAQPEGGTPPADGAAPHPGEQTASGPPPAREHAHRGAPEHGSRRSKVDGGEAADESALTAAAEPQQRRPDRHDAAATEQQCATYDARQGSDNAPGSSLPILTAASAQYRDNDPGGAPAPQAPQSGPRSSLRRDSASAGQHRPPPTALAAGPAPDSDPRRKSMGSLLAAVNASSHDIEMFDRFKAHIVGLVGAAVRSQLAPPQPPPPPPPPPQCPADPEPEPEGEEHVEDGGIDWGAPAEPSTAAPSAAGHSWIAEGGPQHSEPFAHELQEQVEEAPDAGWADRPIPENPDEVRLPEDLAPEEVLADVQAAVAAIRGGGAEGTAGLKTTAWASPPTTVDPARAPPGARPPSPRTREMVDAKVDILKELSPFDVGAQLDCGIEVLRGAKLSEEDQQRVAALADNREQLTRRQRMLRSRYTKGLQRYCDLCRQVNHLERQIGESTGGRDSPHSWRSSIAGDSPPPRRASVVGREAAEQGTALGPTKQGHLAVAPDEPQQGPASTPQEQLQQMRELRDWWRTQLPLLLKAEGDVQQMLLETLEDALAMVGRHGGQPLSFCRAAIRRDDVPFRSLALIILRGGSPERSGSGGRWGAVSGVLLPLSLQNRKDSRPHETLLLTGAGAAGGRGKPTPQPPPRPPGPAPKIQRPARSVVRGNKVQEKLAAARLEQLSPFSVAAQKAR